MPQKQRQHDSYLRVEDVIHPPTLPPHLDAILLNTKSRALDDVCTLEPPSHVSLCHLYALSIRDGVMGLATTTRYRNKFITVVLYRPISSDH